MQGILIAMSPARIAMIRDDDSILTEVVMSRHTTTIPGLLDLGKAWDVIDLLLSGRGEDPLLGDAVCTRSGTKIGPPFGFGRGRLLTQARTQEVARALQALPLDTIRTRYPSLRGQKVHGKFGPKPVEDAPDLLDQLIADEKRAPDAAVDDLESFRRQLDAMPDEEENDDIEDLEQTFVALVDFYVRASAKNQAIYSVVV